VARNLNFVKYPAIPHEEYPVVGAIRYNDDGRPGFVTQTGADELTIRFPEGRAAITPGQALVVYEDADVVAGGWIHRSANTL
jgi:tRNA-specific 2-thiouridylase